MKLSLPKILTLALLLALQSFPVAAINQDIEPAFQESEEAEDDLNISRVARLTFIEGDVSFLRAGVTEWADAAENLPLLAGDQVYAGERSRAEIQLGRGNYIRLSENTALTITELSDEAAQFEVTEGIAIIRVERFPTLFKRIEVDTPNAALVLQQDGLYRVNVQGETYSEVIVRRGLTEVATLDGNFKVREGNRLLVDTSPDGKLEIAADTSTDDWDRWSYDRDTFIDRSTIAAAPDYVNDYETNYDSFYGASELSNHGTWTNVSSYGDCWVPRVDSGWAPYRYGQWLWIPATGWTWLGREPWGWAPYHYGRWAFVNGLGWAWIPGFRSRYYNYGYRDYRWRPALVSFFNCPTPRGQYVGWYPLAPGERWRRSDRRRDRSRLDYPSARNGWRRPGSRDGLTVLPVEGFTRPDRSGARPQAPGRDLRQFVSERAAPGLPELVPSQNSAAPRREGRQQRRAVRPSPEIISRPVVIRNRPTGSQVAVNPPRERRLIVPRKERDFPERPKQRERRADSGVEDNDSPAKPIARPDLDGGRRSRTQTPRLAIPDENGGATPEPRKRERKAENPDQQPSLDRPRENNDGQNRSDKRERSRQVQIPDTRDSDSSKERSRGNEGTPREAKPPAAERTRPPKEERPSENKPPKAERPKSNNDSSAPAKTRNDPTPRSEEPRRGRTKQSSEFRMPESRKPEIRTPVQQEPRRETRAVEVRRERPTPPQVRQVPPKVRTQKSEGRKQRKND
ncbi:MAG: FecR domain-containing protein [Blastocatellia bacterium]|nr:FecR domain-containing protein [Blastocatellia bacterium]